MNKPLIVVVGATGAQGGSVIDYVMKLNKFTLRGITRDPDSNSSKRLIERGVEMVKADLNNMEELKRAFDGAYGVFGVTNFWQKECMEHIWRELEHGKNIVDASRASGAQHLIMSVVDNVDKITGGRLKVHHFTGKGQIEEYMRTVNEIPYRTYLMPSFYMENLFQFSMFQPASDKKSGVLSTAVKPDSRIAMFSVDDFGISVAKAFNDKDSYNNQRMLIASEELTFPELATKVSKALEIPVTYKCMEYEESTKKWGEEMTEMFKWFNEYGYYYGDQRQQVEQANKLFPEMKDAEKWAKLHENDLLDTKSGKA